MKDPRNLLLCGDVHGNVNFLYRAMQRAENGGIDAVFQLGDFGYWEHTAGGRHYLDSVEKAVQATGVPVYWLDGNHENHRMLRATYGNDRTNDEFWEMRDGLYYSPRGHRFTWNGVCFMTVGGAFSIDKLYRQFCDADYPYAGSYWPEEMITDEEVAFATRDGNVKVILSHDAPELPMETTRGNVGFKEDGDSRANRAQIRRIVEAVVPKRLYHGHYHGAYTSVMPFNSGMDLKIRGLDADVNGDLLAATQIIGLSQGAVHER